MLAIKTGREENTVETKENKTQEIAAMGQKVPLQDGSSLYNFNPRLDTMNPLLGHSCPLIVYIRSRSSMLLSLCEHHLLDTAGMKTQWFCNYSYLNWKQFETSWQYTVRLYGLGSANSSFTAYETLLILRRCWQRPPSRGCHSKHSFPSVAVLVM